MSKHLSNAKFQNFTNQEQEISTQKNISIIRIKIAVKRSGMSRAFFYKKLKTDPSMPKKVYLNGTFGKGPVGFVLEEFEEWMKSLVKKSRTPNLEHNTKNEVEEPGKSAKKSVVVAPLPAKIDNLKHKFKQLHDNNEITCKNGEACHDNYESHKKEEAA